MKTHHTHTPVTFFKVKHAKLKVRASSRLSLSPEIPFKWTHTDQDMTPQQADLDRL